MKIFRAHTFQWWEVSLLKLGLISLGLLLGLYFYGSLIGLTLIWWILFVTTSIYFMIRFFSKK